MLTWITRRAERRTNAHDLYGSIVALSRSASIYAMLQVPDTVEGRFEILVLHMFACLERLNGEAPALAQDDNKISQFWSIAVANPVQLPFSKHSGRINGHSRILCATGDGTSVVQRKRATR